MRVSFEAFGNPQSQGSSRAFVNKRTGRAIITAANPENKAWRAVVADAARAAMDGTQPSDSTIIVKVVFYVPRPKSVKRIFPSVKPDLDKLVRSVLDGMTGIVYRDDAQVVTVLATKRYVSDDHPYPGALVSVRVP